MPTNDTYPGVTVPEISSEKVGAIPVAELQKLVAEWNTHNISVPYLMAMTYVRCATDLTALISAHQKEKHES